MTRIIPLFPLVLGAAAEVSLPDPTIASSVGWMVLTGAGVVTILKLCLDTYKEHFREVPRPADTYVRIPDFNDKIEEVMENLRGAVQKIEDFSSDNYDARRRMHKKINGQQNALHYLAGTLSRDGRAHDAAHIKTLIIEEDHAED